MWQLFSAEVVLNMLGTETSSWPESGAGIPRRFIGFGRLGELLQRVEIRQEAAGRFHRIYRGRARVRHNVFIEKPGRPSY